MIPLLLATLLTLQDPKPVTGEWRDLDGIVFVINEDTVTQRGFQKQLAQYLRKNPNMDPRAAQERLKAEIVRGAVGAQAGEAMGIDAALVRRSVRDYERRLIESKGGVDQYSASLAQDGVTAEEMRSDITKYVLREMWEASRTGQGPNQQQKIIADRYMRPGKLRLTYTAITRTPTLVSRIGGASSKVVLQVLELDPAKVGGSAQLESVSAAVRARIASGSSDFQGESGSALATSKSDPTGPYEESSLASTDPELARLVASAKAGDVLPVLRPYGEFKTWRVVRLVERIPAQVPGFKSATVQRTIRDLLQESLDGRRLDYARTQQFQSSYIWPTEEGGN